MPRAAAKRKATEASAQKAKRAKGETDLKDGLCWHEAGNELKGLKPLLVLSSDSLPGCKKIAGFDIDFTVVGTKSGRKFATGPNDWKMLYSCVPDKLRELHKDGYRVVFFTNQAGIEKNQTTHSDVQRKIEGIVAELDIPVLSFASTGNNHFRKPSTAVWDYFVKSCNGGVQPDLSKSFYIGDAAGRAKDWAPGKPKDFSCSDRMFAANVGIKFQTPEEFFLGESPAKFEWHAIDSVDYLKKAPKDGPKSLHGPGQELIIMVGPPASGKSTLSARFLKPHGYEVINRDTLGTAAKCLKALGDALAKGKSCVVDNTNPSAAARGDFIDVAKRAGVPCRCFVMQTPLPLAHHLNFVRQNQTNGKVRRIPDVGYNMYKKHFQEPTKSEGFTDIKKIDFVPKFDSKKDETLFKQWT